MDQATEVVRWALGRAAAIWLSPQVAGSALSVLLVLLVAVRVRFGPRDWTRPLRSKAVRTDAAYAIFYAGGFYAFVVAGPAYRFLTALVERHAPGLQLHLLSHLPVYAQFLVASVTMDGVLYWTHRLMHRSRWLWAFHSVHHSQQELTALANFRFHMVDVFVRGLAQFVPGLLLGVPARVWLPTVWIQVALDCLAHSGLGWGYGPLGALVVSPGFHRVHHSAEPGHYNTNFGMTYSFWDRLFGTSAPRAEAPSRYGVPGLGVPESFTRQLAFPFLFLAGGVPSRDPGEGEP
jgi:sterol desaturase/sphingolipid hydroxylase (fatty acid hydroxylase superfamily)